MLGFLQKNMLVITLLFAVIVTGGTLMVVSQNVYEKQGNIRNKSRILVEQQWELRTLKAEWAYLSRPDRIDELSTAMGKGQPAAAIISMQSVVRADDVTPVNMMVPTPPNKPFYMIRPASGSKNMRQQTPSQTVAPSVAKTNPKPNNDFSSLLKTIGGGQ